MSTEMLAQLMQQNGELLEQNETLEEVQKSLDEAERLRDLYLAAADSAKQAIIDYLIKKGFNPNLTLPRAEEELWGSVAGFYEEV